MALQNKKTQHKDTMLALFFLTTLALGDAFTIHTVKLPVSDRFQAHSTNIVDSAFAEMIDSTYGLEHCQRDVARIPVFGDSATISFAPTHDDNGVVTDYTITGCEMSAQDFGWVCAKFYESKDSFDGLLNTSTLRNTVIDHFNLQKAHPGYDAMSCNYCDDETTRSLLTTPHLYELATQGYTVIDATNYKTAPHQHAKLTTYLNEKTNQGESVRTDTVHFLNRQQAVDCDLDAQYDLLMSIAKVLNSQFPLEPSPYKPIAPATIDAPLTVPGSIQLAEYEKGGYYKAHSDNTLGEAGIRSNFRHLTCILYCNDVDRSGALRIYKDSSYVHRPEEALSNDYIDILPRNGRLVIFKSTLIHAVRPVEEDVVRRALTLWINRPDDSGVQCEQFY